MQETATKERPFGVTILAILSGLAAAIAIYHTIQMLGLLPFKLFNGAFEFFNFSIVGALLYGLMAAIWIWLTLRLWNVDSEAWLFVVAFTIINLLFNVVAVLGATTFQELLPGFLINGALLIYALLPGTREAFGT